MLDVFLDFMTGCILINLIVNMFLYNQEDCDASYKNS